MLTKRELERIAKRAVEVEHIRNGHGDHAPHSQRFAEPHWIVCSCGDRAVATATQVAAVTGRSYRDVKPPVASSST